MADIFVSYTSADRDWAAWIGQQLENLGHTAHLDYWEISGGGNIMAWMEERHHKADHILCVVSSRYLKRPFSAVERQAAQWAAASERPNFLLPVFIESCEPPTLLAPFRRCDLYGVNENEMKERLAAFMKPAAKPAGPVPFPGSKQTTIVPNTSVAFPGGQRALSNIPTSVPRYFLGRNEVLAKIKIALASDQGRVAIAALHGLRGVGKTTLAAAYAEQNRAEYRATWWIRGETESTMRADLVGLGVRLGWVVPDATEEPALGTVLEQLRDNGDGILLIYDNAISPNEIRKYLPRGSTTQIIVTSNAPNWGAVATPVEIEVWPTEIGADYLMARAGRKSERDAALALSEALDGLPLAHEQAAAYCERVGVTLAEYKKRFEAAPAVLLDARDDASREYHDGLTVAKAFALAIDEAAKLHPAAEPLIVHAALLAPEPIPLYLFSEALEKFGEPFASSLKGNDLDEAVAVLRAFALIDRESISDERDPTITTDCIRLHRLVRQVASERFNAEAQIDIRRKLINAIALVYPKAVESDPSTWLRARRLDAIALAQVRQDIAFPDGTESTVAYILNQLAEYRQAVLGAYRIALPLCEQALDICEKVLGTSHPDTARSLNNLGYLLQSLGDLDRARPYHERALAIREKTLGPDHPDTARSLNNLGGLLQSQDDLAGARPHFERALAIVEKALGPNHPDTAMCLNNLGGLLDSQGDLTGARPHFERALAIVEKALGRDHPDTAMCLNNLGHLLQAQGDFAGAQPHCERALAIREKALGPDHPDTAMSLSNLGSLLRAQDDLSGARPHYERALVIREKALGPDHPDTATSLDNLGYLLQSLGDLSGAWPYHERALAIREKALGADHPDTATSLSDLGYLLQAQGHPARARPYFERALDISEKKLGLAHPNSWAVATDTAVVFDQLGLKDEAAALRRKFGLEN